MMKKERMDRSVKVVVKVMVVKERVEGEVKERIEGEVKVPGGAGEDGGGGSEIEGAGGGGGGAVPLAASKPATEKKQTQH